MADMITRCPQCGTAFRITPAHLRSARGSVRCGSCLQVFNARENLTEEAPPAPAPAHEKAPSSPPPVVEHGAEDMDEMLISDDMPGEPDEPDEDDDEELNDVFMAEATQTSLFERVPSNAHDEDEQQVDTDETWALKLLDEDDAEPVSPAAAGTGIDVERDEVAAAEPGIPTDVHTVEDEQDGNPTDTGVDESHWLDQDESSARLSNASAEQEMDAFTSPSFAAGQRDGVGSAYLDAIEPEPVEVAFRQEKPVWRSRLLWGGLSLLALVILLAQMAWLQYPSLNRTEPYRSFYAWACDVVGCTLPPQQDLGAIRTSNVVVRSHPRQAGALIVDVVLQNTAAFRQPFPKLAVTFSNLQSEVVAQRHFSPEEYLGGELAGQTMMPVRQPVHVAIEIVDPGEEAVNYRIEVAGNQTL